METKMIIVPFDVELAKKITKGKIDGKVVTRDGGSARIICWDSEGDQPIIALVKFHDKEYPHSFYQNGSLHDGDCLNGDLMLEIPEYMTFKDGDVITYDDKDALVALKGEPVTNEDGFATCNFYVNIFQEHISFYNPDVSVCVNKARKANEEETKRFLEKLKKDDRKEAKEYIKQFFGIEVKSECKFKPFDKVLVRYHDSGKWVARFFDRMSDGLYYCTDSLSYYRYIPYEGNEKLHNTTDKLEE